MQQRLMIVRPVDVHQPFTQRGQNTERGGGTVDELAVRAGGGKHAFEHQLLVFARFQAVIREIVFQGNRQSGDIEDRLDRTTFRAAAQEGAIRAFTQDQVERANKNGFAGTGFAGDDVAPRLEFQRQVRHQREVFDAQRDQHR